MADLREKRFRDDTITAFDGWTADTADVYDAVSSDFSEAAVPKVSIETVPRETFVRLGCFVDFPDACPPEHAASVEVEDGFEAAGVWKLRIRHGSILRQGAGLRPLAGLRWAQGSRRGERGKFEAIFT